MEYACVPLTWLSFGFRAAMTQILAPDSAVLAVTNRVRNTHSLWNHDLEAMWRPISVFTIPGHTLLTTTRGLVGDNKPSVRLYVCLLRIVIRLGRWGEEG